MESRQARHGSTEKGQRRQCGNGAWQGKQVTGRVRVAHKTDCGELCELLPQTEREREMRKGRGRERGKETYCLPGYAQHRQQGRKSLHVMANQSRRRNNLIWNKGKVSEMDR